MLSFLKEISLLDWRDREKESRKLNALEMNLKFMKHQLWVKYSIAILRLQQLSSLGESPNSVYC